MNSAGLIALDNGLRGVAVGLFFGIGAVLLRDRPHSAAARLSAALGVCAIAYAIREAPSFPRPWPWWALPLAAAGWASPAIFWLWAQATFDDEFRFRRGHAAMIAAMIGLGLLAYKGPAFWPALEGAGDHALALAELALALLAIAQTLSTWRTDLVARRRRLRIVNLIGAFTFFAASGLADLSIVPRLSGSPLGSLVDALGLSLLAIFYGASVLQAAGTGLHARAAATLGDGAAQAGALIAPEKGGSPSVEPALLSRLERLMGVERAYRQEGLTIGALATRLNLPEYRLRALINEGLGYRNFNAFLNRCRIEEAKAALGDSTQKEVPVITIAMDCGFQSLGPFNRAFKADTGLTPTEFRRLALAKAPTKPLGEQKNLEIGDAR